MSQDDIVELEFLIDDFGNPYNIHVTKSLDEEKNSKAIDILKSGPRWTNTSKKKKAKLYFRIYSFFNLVVLADWFFLPQHMNPSLIPIIALLIYRGFLYTSAEKYKR